MLFNYFFTNGQTYTGALKFMVAMQPFKYHENLLRIFLVESNPIVSNGSLVITGCTVVVYILFELTQLHFFGVNVYLRRNLFFPELKSITYQIIKQLLHKSRNNPN